MLFSDDYRVPLNEAQSSLREKGSRFLSFVYPVESEIEVKERLDNLRKLYPDASHHCYAYVIGIGSEAQRANDDGEPANSAGRPILRAILSAQITNVLVVVVRYFGGTLLGIPGLIQAYGTSAKVALDLAGFKLKLREIEFRVSVDFANEQELHKIASKYNAKIVESLYTDSGLTARIRVKNSMASAFETGISQHYQLTLISPN